MTSERLLKMIIKLVVSSVHFLQCSIAIISDRSYFTEIISKSWQCYNSSCSPHTPTSQALYFLTLSLKLRLCLMHSFLCCIVTILILCAIPIPINHLKWFFSHQSSRRYLRTISSYFFSRISPALIAGFFVSIIASSKSVYL